MVVFDLRVRRQMFDFGISVRRGVLLIAEFCFTHFVTDSPIPDFIPMKGHFTE